MAGTLQRIQHLFRRGDVVVLDAKNPDTGETEKVPVFVAKLNSFEKDEAIKDARAARARRILAFDRDEDEQLQIAVLLSGMSDQDVVVDLLRRKVGEMQAKAEDEVRADKKWRERLEAIDRAEIAEDGNASEQERQLLADLIAEFHQAVEVARSKLMREAKRDLDALTREELEADYRSAWREMVGSTAFFENRRQSEIWYALRECEVQLDAADQPIMSTLVVGDRVCPTRADVNLLPDDIVRAVLLALDGEMTSREAGNSDAPSASSGSSEQRSAEAASHPSTPTAM